MNILTQSAVQTMSSREIAELTGKRHCHVTRDIRDMISRHPNFDCIKSKYIDGSNRNREEYLLPKQSFDWLIQKYKGALSIPSSLQENAALDAIEQVLGIRITRQFSIGSYRVDGYDAANNTVYEIDESYHKYQIIKDAKRQRYIEKLLGCKFIRIDISKKQA